MSAVTVGAPGTLAAALAAAQGEMSSAKKDGTNPHFASHYATLAAVWDACREPLAKHGLAVVQTTERDDGGLVLITSLLHSSGEAVSGRMPVVAGKAGDMQSLGSALTYARRYGLAAIVGIAPDDDDGEAAVGRRDAAPPRKATAAKPVSREPGEDDAPPLGHGEHDLEPLARIPAAKSPDYRSPAALGKELLRLTGDRDGAMALLTELCGASSLSGMPPAEVGPAWAALAKHAKWGRP